MEGPEAAFDPAWVKDAFVFLGAAGIVVPLFHRARVGAVFGFLVVGLVVGPFGLGQLKIDFPLIDYLTISDPRRVEPFAELGVIFLLFLLGLELSLERLWQLRRYLLGVGATQVGLSALAIGIAAGLLGASREVAIVLGLCLALSSTAIVMQLLREQSRTTMPIGRLALAVLLFQDLMVVPILFVTGVLGAGGGDGVVLPLLIALGQALIAIAVIVVAGRLFVHRLLRFVFATGSRDLIMAVTVLVVVAAAGATGAAGLSTALGAFLAGLLLGESEFRHQIEIDLDPFKGILLGLFFVSVGMSVDVFAVAAQAHNVALAVLGLLAVKAAILFVAARIFGVPQGLSVESAVLLAQSGEFAFVVIALARSDGLIAAPLAQFATAVVGLTMLVTPFLAVAARRLGARADDGKGNADALPAKIDEFGGRVIIVGFGRVGQAVARVLDAESVPYLALDCDAALVTRERKRGRAVLYGDGRRPEALERVGAEHAPALVITLSDGEEARSVVEMSRARWEEVPVFARAKDESHALGLAKLGATVMPEVLEPSLQLAGRVLERLGMSDDRVALRLEQARETELGRLAAPAGSRSAKERTKRKRGRAAQR